MPYMHLPPARPAHTGMLDGRPVFLEIRQQPKCGLITQDNKEKNRKPIDPPPIIQMVLDPPQPYGTPETSDHWLVSPYLFMIVTVLDGEEGDHIVPGTPIIGQSCASLHRLKDINNKDGGFFVFGDISIKKLGRHRLRFNLFNADQNGVKYLAHIDSEAFPVCSNKDFQGLSESSHLSRTFSDQGVRLRLRKEPRHLSNNGGVKRSYQDEPSPPQVQRQGSHYGYDTPSTKRQRSDSDYNNPHAYPPYADASYGHGGTPGARTWIGQDNLYQQGHGMSGIHAPYDGPQPTYNMRGHMSTTMAPVTTSNIPRTFAQGPLSAPAGTEYSIHRSTSVHSRHTYFGNDYGARSGTQYEASQLHTPVSMTGQPIHQGGYMSSNVPPGGLAGPSDIMGSSIGQHGLPNRSSFDRPISTQPDFAPLQPAALMPAQFAEVPNPLAAGPVSQYPEASTSTAGIVPHPYAIYTPTSLSASSGLGDTMLNSAFGSADSFPSASQSSGLPSQNAGSALQATADQYQHPGQLASRQPQQEHAYPYQD